ncbi:MAG: hypothetical protein JWQ98_415 [Chlorobi bacterium]|nr:hypothetical protein [Chlorobiota bacterium]
MISHRQRRRWQRHEGGTSGSDTNPGACRSRFPSLGYDRAQLHPQRRYMRLLLSQERSGPLPEMRGGKCCGNQSRGCRASNAVMPGAYSATNSYPRQPVKSWTMSRSILPLKLLVAALPGHTVTQLGFISAGPPMQPIGSPASTTRRIQERRTLKVQGHVLPGVTAAASRREVVADEFFTPSHPEQLLPFVHFILRKRVRLLRTFPDLRYPVRPG